MAKSVKINGVIYPSVPSVEIPLSSGSGNAVFVDSSDATAKVSDIRSGATAYVNGVKFTGTIPSKSSLNVTISGKTITVPKGIYDTDVSKSVSDGSVTPSATVTGTHIGTTATSYPIEITPSAAVGTAGYVSSVSDGSKITRYIQVEDKSVTPTTSSQEITPSTGKLLKKVTVNAVDLSGTASAADVAAGKTFYSDSLTKITGTGAWPSISQDSSTSVLTIA